MEYLIPSEWFQDLPEWGLLVLVILSMVTLMTGADWLVESAILPLGPTRRKPRKPQSINIPRTIRL